LGSLFVAPNYNALMRDGTFRVVLLQRKRILLRIRNKQMIQDANQPLGRVCSAWSCRVSADERTLLAIAKTTE